MSFGSSCISGKFLYTVNIPIKTFTTAESSEIESSRVQWKVKLCKKSSVLAVYLESSLGSESSETLKWSCEAQAAFKLLHKDGRNDKSIVKYLPKQKFGHSNLCSGFEDFINWTDFLEYHVADNQAVFEIEISTNPLKLNYRSEVDQTYAKFRVILNDVSTAQCYDSPKIFLRGVEWWTYIIQEKNGDLSLGLSANTKQMISNWSYKASAVFKLLSYADEIAPLERRIETAEFRHEMDSCWGLYQFIRWPELFDVHKQYVLGDQGIMEIELNVNEPTPLWDIGPCTLSKSNSMLQCRVCFDCFSSGEIYSTKCGHLYCRPCFTKSIDGTPICSVCKKPTSSDELHPIYFS